MTLAAHAPQPPVFPPPRAHQPHHDDAWWIELFAWQAALIGTDPGEPADERSLREASLLALLSVA